MKKLPIVSNEEIVLGDGEGEKASDRPESLARPVNFVSAVFVGMGMCLVVVLLFGFATSQLIVECLIDGTWTRMAFVAAAPFLMLVGLFLYVLLA